MFDDNHSDDSSTEQNNTSDYAFFADEEPEEEPREVRKWKLGKHSARPSVDADELRASADTVDGIDDDLADLFREAADRVPNATVNDFECPVCGLTHGHSDDKHDIRDSFDVRPEFAEMMQFNAACHCGVNEMAMLVDFFDHIGVRVFTDEASLTQKELDRRFDNIRRAAEGAKIAQPTENTIEKNRQSLEGRFRDDSVTAEGGY